MIYIIFLCSILQSKHQMFDCRVETSLAALLDCCIFQWQRSKAVFPSRERKRVVSLVWKLRVLLVSDHRHHNPMAAATVIKKCQIELAVYNSFVQFSALDCARRGAALVRTQFSTVSFDQTSIRLSVLIQLTPWQHFSSPLILWQFNRCFSINQSNPNDKQHFFLS